ncbi:MAG: tRNA epoxyqueuosine(34) reductase QueG [Bacteroidaceae bacterium]|nr:tRNA epoxyqueuosine(34) reductase QueG [Bacteroidaceae bacterium]
MTQQTITQHIKAEALRLGFSACGVARADEVARADSTYFRSWLSQGGNAAMTYMADHQPQRLDPRTMYPGTRSVIAVALNYFPESRLPADTYQFAYYAYGKDYHDVMRSRLRLLAAFVMETAARLRTATTIPPRVCTDTAPLLERYWAWKAGLGWIGRNHNLIIPGKGSFVVLGEILTDLLLEADTPMPSQCGDCHRCTDACPCLAAPVFKAEDCWSYQTIEKKDEATLPRHEVVEDTGGDTTATRQERQGRTPYIYGCDRCQLVCPHNWFATPTDTEEFRPSPLFLSMTKDDWNTLTPERYRALFKGSAVKRAKFGKLTSTISLLRH